MTDIQEHNSKFYKDKFMRDSFKVIRIQAIEQCLELIKQKIGSSSDPRSIIQLMDDLRVMLEYTKEREV
jgi:hypothetical protein